MTPNATSKSWVLFGFAAVVFQALGIAIFIMVSRGGWRGLGKPVALVGTLMADLALLVWILRKPAKVQSIFVAAVCLSAAYVAAFHLVGAIAFAGLLRDIGTRPANYLSSILRVSAAALLLFTMFSAVVFAALRLPRRRLRKRIE